MKCNLNWRIWTCKMQVKHYQSNLTSYNKISNIFSYLQMFTIRYIYILIYIEFLLINSNWQILSWTSLQNKKVNLRGIISSKERRQRYVVYFWPVHYLWASKSLWFSFKIYLVKSFTCFLWAIIVINDFTIEHNFEAS